MKIIFATGNAGKMREVREILKDLNMEVLSMKEAGITADIVEDGTTFEENALIKVRAIGPMDDAVILADDSGLEIDALNKEPGVYSARYLGEDTSYEIKNKTILARLSDTVGSERSCRYRCVIAAMFPDGFENTVSGSMEGVISHFPAGDGGFGYDPIFYIPELKKTVAEMTMDEKNVISHRGLALEGIKPVIRNWMELHA